MKIITFKCDFCDFEETCELGGGAQFPRVLLLIGHKEACRECTDKAQKLLDQKGYSTADKVQAVYAKTARELARAVNDIEKRDGIIIRKDGSFPNFQITYLPYEHANN